MAADVRVIFVGSNDHGGGVPADQAFNAALELAVAGIGDFIFGRNRIYVGRVPAQGRLHAEVGSTLHEPFQQVAGPVRPGFVDDFVEGFNPFGGFLGIEVVGSLDFGFQHGV